MAGGFGSGMSGASAGWMEDAFKDMREDLWNERGYYERGRDREHAVEDAKLAYQRNIDAYRMRYQWTMEDMRNAGLNPMLVASQGVGGVPSAQAASQTSAGFPKPSGSGNRAIGVSAYAQAASAQQSLANAELTQSTAQKLQAETAEIQARTPVHAVSIQKMEQEMKESVQRIQTLMATEEREYTSAAQMAQHTVNLKESVPQIRATVEMLKAQTGEIKQRVQQNLPEIERLLKDLEARVKDPQSYREAKVHSHPLTGTLGALLKILNPLAGFIAVSK